jgi:hypothetical protein
MFSPTPVFPDHQASTSTDSLDQYYNTSGGYYVGEVWPTQPSGTAAGQYMDENGSGYGYYAPTEHGLPNQYDNRDRSSPPQYPYTFDYNNGPSA